MTSTACKYCGALTARPATRQCDNCWEVCSRIQYTISIPTLEKIITDVKPEFLAHLRRTSGE